MAWRIRESPTHVIRANSYIAELDEWTKHLANRVEHGTPLPPNFLLDMKALFNSASTPHWSLNEIVKAYNAEKYMTMENNKLFDEESPLHVSIGIQALQDMLNGSILSDTDEYYRNSISALESILNGMFQERRRPKAMEAMEIAFADNAHS